MNRRDPRNRLSMIYDILVCCSKKALLISEIGRKANLSSKNLYRLVDSLAESGYLVKKVCDCHDFYFVSPKGREFIHRYDALLAVDNPNYPVLQNLAFLTKSYIL